MKKFVILLFAALILCACNVDSEKVIHSDFCVGHLRIIELTFNGETHEYVLYDTGYRGSVSHWEGCKYCKEKHAHEETLCDTIYVVQEKAYKEW